MASFKVGQKDKEWAEDEQKKLSRTGPLKVNQWDLFALMRAAYEKASDLPSSVTKMTVVGGNPKHYPPNFDIESACNQILGKLDTLTTVIGKALHNSRTAVDPKGSVAGIRGAKADMRHLKKAVRKAERKNPKSGESVRAQETGDRDADEWRRDG